MQAPDSTDATDAAPAAVFRKPKRPKNARVRDSEPDGADAGAEPGGSDVVHVTKAQKPNPLVVGTRKVGARPTLGEEVAHASDRRISQYDNKVTASSEQDIEHGNDAQAQYEAARRMWEDGGDVAADGSKIYRGQKAYRQYTNKAESYDNQVNSGAGPARAPVHYRASSRFDYAPDICKDYKDTGYCGYGDSCKFLHDRSDYKSGWQLERQWDEQQREKAHTAAVQAFEDAEGGGGAGTSASGGGADEDDRLPFACLICREPWHATSRPVMSRCEHYFCEACALKHAAKTKRCFVCAENTGGIFNSARAIQEKIDRMQRAEECVAAADESDEKILAEYEEAKRKARGYTGGWGLV